MIAVHRSHKFGAVYGTVCCVVCYVEKDWPLAEKVCGTEDRAPRQELRRRATKPATDEDRRKRGHATDAEILAAIRDGLRVTHIMERTRAGLDRVREVARKNGAEIQPDGRRSRTRPAEDLAKIAADYAGGMKVQEIQKAHGVSHRVIARALAEHGVPVRTGSVKK